MPDLKPFAVNLATQYVVNACMGKDGLGMTNVDKRATHEIVNGRLDGMNWETFTVQALYDVCSSVIDDWNEMQEDNE